MRSANEIADCLVAELRQAEDNRQRFLRDRFAAEAELGGVTEMTDAERKLRHATWCEAACYATRQEIEYAVRVILGAEAWEGIAARLTWEQWPFVFPDAPPSGVVANGDSG